jgi:hypothetical protein
MNDKERVVKRLLEEVEFDWFNYIKLLRAMPSIYDDINIMMKGDKNG